MTSIQKKIPIINGSHKNLNDVTGRKRVAGATRPLYDAVMYHSVCATLQAITDRASARDPVVGYVDDVRGVLELPKNVNRLARSMYIPKKKRKKKSKSGNGKSQVKPDDTRRKQSKRTD